jgi:hypothetical protein
MYEFIIWVSYLAIKRVHSDGSSPVATTPLLNHFLVINRFYFHAGVSVRENRYTIFIDY